MWYGSGNYVGTTYHVTDVQNVSMNANDGQWKYNVYAVAYYVNQGTNQTAQTPTYQVQLAALALNTIAQSAPAYLNCPTAVTFSTSWVSQFYVPQAPSDISSYTWSFPSSGWTITSSGAGSANTAPTVTVTPDANSAGNVMVTTTLNCGYTFTSPVLAITRPTQPPTFGSNPTAICDNATNTFSVNGPCGATGYSWTLSGNAGATFQASGTQSLTTTSPSAVISSGSVGNSNVTLSVASVYPGGATSSPASVSITTGLLPAPTQIIPASGSETVPPGSLAEFYASGGNFWSASDGTVTAGQGGDDAAVRIANVTSGTLIVHVSAKDACGTSSPLTAEYQIVQGSPTPLAYKSGILSDSSDVIASVHPLGNTPPTSLALYPNPATNSFQVILPQTDFTKTYLKIYDISGHSIQTIIPSGQNTLVDASHWAKGTYIVSIFDGQKLTTQKFVKR